MKAEEIYGYEFEDGKELHARTLNDICEALENISPYIAVTYDELVTLVNDSKLIPGRIYRITDFVTTVANDSKARSVQEYQRDNGLPIQQFDILVTADSTSTLNENAKAIQHEDDNTYFSNSELSSWELKYSLENDDTRFAWADTTNGKGVIYYMKDEWNNECPYDFKNIQFKRYAITGVEATGVTSDMLTELRNTFVYNNNGGRCFATKDVYGNLIPQDISYTGGLGGTSVETSIHWNIDEATFKWYYTFNGEKKDSQDGPIELYDVTTNKFVLTPECIQWLEDNDSGTNISDNCYNNVIEPRTWEYFEDDGYYKGRIVLNNIVFLNGVSYCYYLTEDEYWEHSTVYCYGNVFGVECRNNTFGNDIYNNTFGNDIYNNTFGNSVDNNTFGNSVYYNTFGNDIYHNTFGNNIWYNTFSNGVGSNTFGNDVGANTFGNEFTYNTVGEDITWLNFVTNYPNGQLYHLNITNGCKSDSQIDIPVGIATSADYCQFIGLKSSGDTFDSRFTIKNMFD